MTVKELQKIRKKYKLAQYKVAEKLGLNNSSMNHWENGKVVLKNEADLLKKYKDYLLKFINDKQGKLIKELASIENDLEKLK